MTDQKDSAAQRAAYIDIVFDGFAEVLREELKAQREAGIREALEVLDAFATQAIDAGLDYQGQIALEQAEQRIRALLEGDR